MFLRRTASLGLSSAVMMLASAASSRRVAQVFDTYAATASTDPVLQDQAWQKASAKV